MSTNLAPNPQKITLPDIPALAVNARQAAIMDTDGEIKLLPHERAAMLVHKKPVLVCHAPFTRGRLGQDDFYAFDILELFAFTHPTAFAVPTPAGLCKALGLDVPKSLEDFPLALFDVARALLSDLQKQGSSEKADPLKISGGMGLRGKGWNWTPFIFSALGQSYDEAEIVNTRTAMNVWRKLPEWAEEAPAPPPSHFGVSTLEAKERLQNLIGHDAEQRMEQREYTAHIAHAFEPPTAEDQAPHVVLAEAGTGVGKTLGYLAPASVWAEKNQGTVWLSTYTKNLQRQIDQELDRLYPDPEIKKTNVAIRKGRENYLCLLNLEESAAAAETTPNPAHAIAAGIMARWAATTKDGDLTGADFPGWLPGLLGFENTSGLSDRRGECVYSACDHYSRCFIERSQRKAARARIVVANHALVMINAALGSAGVADMPTRYIFDEGHHLFSAADSAFAAHLSAQETRELRQWILGAEGGKRTRARGLKRRLEDLIAGDADGEKLLEDIIYQAKCLSAQGWTRRFKDGAPAGPCEQFLELVYKQVYARAEGRSGPYSLETETFPVEKALLEKAAKLHAAFKALHKPVAAMAALLRKKLHQDNGEMSGDTRRRLDAMAASLEHRGEMTLKAWMMMLEALKAGQNSLTRHSGGAADAALKQPKSTKSISKADRHMDPVRASAPDGARQRDDDVRYVDWFAVERIDGRAVDVGYYRHHADPMKPFAAALAPYVQGMAVTSATLRDGSPDEEQNWRAARLRSGAQYLTPTPLEAAFNSPFDYPNRTKVFIVNDVNKNDLEQVAGAYRALFMAANGGALGLFTAISRLRAVHNHISAPLEDAGLPLYSQHVDEIDAGTLVDIFRDDIHACLLGTDAVRDGVDVPGESLRLIVFDRVPWPRPDILHKARRNEFGGRQYDEMLTRLKLKQAFGRLVRRAGDKGVFVMLDPMLPSRLHGAFPEGVEIIKTSLAETCTKIKTFY